MTSSAKSQKRSKLPFDPVSTDYKVLNNGEPILLSPADAEHILLNHNEDNRPISSTQVSKIKKGILNNFRKDGQPITFNTAGNLTEKQHTLSAISGLSSDLRFPFLIAVGVEPDCFSTTVPAKSRTPKDEVQRKDPSCSATEYSTLAAIAARQSQKITCNNAVELWNLWMLRIRAGIASCDSFWDSTKGQVFTQIKGTVHAFASIGHLDYKDSQIRMLLDQISDHLDDKCIGTPLAESLYEFFRENTGDGDYGHNKAKEKFLFRTLCVGLDKILENEDGDIKIGLTLNDEDKEKMLLSDVDETETYKRYTTMNPMTKR